jgi:uncharacterized circularly permuted ATP-grasp superfamily protein/uncharacterized alpha-E superfamily protein
MPPTPPLAAAAADPDRGLSAALSTAYMGLVSSGLPGTSCDEVVDAHGAIRPHWQTLADSVDRLGATEITQRWDRSQEVIHDNGVSFNVYGDAQGMERPWPLSPLPVLLGPDEFAALAAGLDQRARLIDAVLADIYGPQRALAEGWLPPELVLAHPGFLRPCAGFQPSGGRYLHFYAADVVRVAEGRFEVLVDRTQAPAGAGYALENRIVVSRALPEAFRACNTERLALFFRGVRELLASLAPPDRENPRIVLLSPGPYNATYFEQAFLAQYLGYMLVEGADLTVRDGKVFLKTLGGLHRVDVILRRLNDDYCDPLELRGESTLGIPGLLEAARQGGVAVANALGSGLAQTPALLPYLPALARGLLGEELALPSVETFWCGEPAALEHVVAHLPEMVVKPAYPAGATQPLFGDALAGGERERLRDRLRAEPGRWVAQRRVLLSTTPLLTGGELQPRRLKLRMFAVAPPVVSGAGAGAGFQIMPGALGLVADAGDGRDISIQRGARSKDTWVTSGGPVSTFSLLRAPGHPVPLSRGGGDLPSRVADNLFWLGRYAERAEAIARLARVASARILEPSFAGVAEGTEVAALLSALEAQTRIAADQSAAERSGALVPETALLAAVFDAAHPGTLRATVQAIHRVARAIRDRISSDTWRVITSLVDELRYPLADRALASTSAMLDRTITTVAALSGLVMESMTRGQGWRFLDIGRRLERALTMVVTLQNTLSRVEEREGPLLEALLEVADSGITYRRRYLATLQAAPVVDLLLADETNPRAVAYQLAALSEHMTMLPNGGTGIEENGPAESVARALGDLRALDVEWICQPDPAGQRPELRAALGVLLAALPQVSDALGHVYWNHTKIPRHLADPVSVWPAGT